VCICTATASPEKEKMNERVDYFISGVKIKEGHVTHLRIHKALSNNSFAPHGILQPRSTMVVNIKSKHMVYRTLVEDGDALRPAERVHLIEHGCRFYLRIQDTPEPGDNLGVVPEV
jgi:hypothetical protein